MKPVFLHHVWKYTDADRAFWQEHLEAWMPRRIVDAHVHVTDPVLRKVEPTEEKRRSYWVCEVNEPQDADGMARCYGVVFPEREAELLCFGQPNLDYDLDASNAYTSRECAARGWHGLALCRPQWNAARCEQELDRPAILGYKPYYALIGASKSDRDTHLEASIFDFLPHHQLEVLNDRGGWLTLHVPHADRLGHPDNLREVREIRRRYPDIVLVIAHLGRSYTEPHAREGLLPLADDPGLFFDNSAVLNPAVHRLALDVLGPERILYGTDNPVFYMRGRRQWSGRTYTNRTNHPFHFNKEHESPDIEARYTLYMYEALKAFKDACDDLGLGQEAIEAVMHGNARRLIDAVVERKDTRTKD